jgi:hypothetical protein
VANISHGMNKFLSAFCRRLLRQPGHPRNLGPVAFRPPITRSLALSVI